LRDRGKRNQERDDGEQSFHRDDDLTSRPVSQPVSGSAPKFTKSWLLGRTAWSGKPVIFRMPVTTST
jgi:hypothetical protein